MTRIAVLLLLLIGTAAPARCERMPEKAPTVLREVLDSKEFQRSRRSPGIVERVKAALGAKLRQLKERISDWLWEQSNALPPNSWLARSFAFLASVVDALGTMLVMLARLLPYLALAAVAAFILIRLYRRERRSDEHDGAPRPRAEERPAMTLDEIRRIERGGERLLAFRNYLRTELTALYGAPTALTDRELEGVCPAGDRRELFRAVAALFERAVYAQRPFDSQQLSALVARYDGLHGSDAR